MPETQHTPQALSEIERIYIRYLYEAPMSYALWRCQEFMALRNVALEDPVLDLGCGEGLFSSFMFPGHEVIGMDISEMEVRRAREFGIHRLTLVADGCHLPFQDNSFGSVVSNCVIEHVPDLGALLCEVHRVLRPGGLFLATVPTDQFAPNLFFSRVFSTLGLGIAARAYGRFVNRMFSHAHVYSETGWARVFQDAGFDTPQTRSIMPGRVVSVFDLGMYPAYYSYLVRKTFGKWILVPGTRGFWVPLIFRLTRGLLHETGGPGGALMIEAHKPR